MNKVSIDNIRQILVVEPQGLDKIWGFVRRIEVPIDQVRGATHDPGPPRTIRACVARA